jgi:hypothetical protein
MSGDVLIHRAADLLMFMLRPMTHIQGGAVNLGLNWSMYRPSCLIEAYVRTEKYWLVWAGLKANHLFNFNFIFLSDSLTAAAERAAGLADFYRHLLVPFRGDGRM